MAKQYERLLKGVMNQAMSSGRMGQKYLESKVKRIWEQNMGQTIQGYTREIRLHKKTIYISIVSAPLRAELNLGKAKILELINGQLGQQYIEEVVIQ